MSFEYIEDDDATANAIRPRLYGFVPCFSGEYAIDREHDAIVVDLGGQPERDPSDKEGPAGYFNLLWGADVYAAEGYTRVERLPEGFVTIFSLAVIVPRAALGSLEEARRLLEKGLGTLRSGHAGRPVAVQVIFTALNYR